MRAPSVRRQAASSRRRSPARSPCQPARRRAGDAARQVQRPIAQAGEVPHLYVGHALGDPARLAAAGGIGEALQRGDLHQARSQPPGPARGRRSGGAAPTRGRSPARRCGDDRRAGERASIGRARSAKRCAVRLGEVARPGPLQRAQQRLDRGVEGIAVPLPPGGASLRARAYLCVQAARQVVVVAVRQLYRPRPAGAAPRSDRTRAGDR